MRIIVVVSIGTRNGVSDDVNGLVLGHRVFPLALKDGRPRTKSHHEINYVWLFAQRASCYRTTKVKRASRVLRTASIWAPVVLSSAHALADDSPTQKVQAAKADANARTEPVEPHDQGMTKASSEQLAAVAYQKAVASYANGDLTGALDSMRESYQLSKRAELLYNLAQLEEELKACSDALTDYGRYLELVPNGRYRESAKQARVRLEQECAPQTPAPPSPAPLTHDPPPAERAVVPEQTSYWTAARIIGWSTVSIGTLAGAGAIYLQLEAVQARNELQQSIDNANAGGPAVDMALQDRMHRYNHAAIGLGITSGAMIASGALVLLLDPGKAEQRAHSASLYALPGLVGATYAQCF